MKDKLAIIVPFRDRQNHLDIFVPHMNEFLKDTGINYTIFIAEQTDDRPFNYGKLCNVVVNEIDKEYTYFAFHDIDMLPINDECDYSYPDSPTQLSTKVQAHDNKLPYPQYFGGVVLINREDFEEANGYSNEYWGYGFCDLDLLYRLNKSGAYLEKFYDLNKIYSNYEKDDILPYRIENINTANNDKTHTLNCVKLNKDSFGYGELNPLGKNNINGSFSISLWFKDTDNITTLKNLFCLEGVDSGLFLKDGKQIMAQLWDDNKKNYEVFLDYFRNRWNHVVFIVDKFIPKNKLIKKYRLRMVLNGKSVETELLNDFKIYSGHNNIKISNIDTSIELANILMFSHPLEEKHINELYYSGNKSLDYIETHFGLIPSSIFDFGNQNKNLEFESHHNKKIILDRGTNSNHLKVEGNASTFEEEISTTDDLWLPIRIAGKYNSLTHTDDKNIIDKYYKFDPDVEENADIFFNDILTNEINWKDIGLNSLKYEAAKSKTENYTLFKIIT